MSNHPTIPDDVLAAAEDLIPQMTADPGKQMRGSMVYYAAKAMMQERERCANLAESTLPEHADDDDWYTGAVQTKYAIAAAIRGE